MRITREHVDEQRKQRVEERRKALMKNPEVYRRDFDEAFKSYLRTNGLDQEDDDNRFNPHFREDFTWSPEGRELAIKYSLECAWDPDGDEPPYPVVLPAARVIRCQDDRIWLNQIQKGSIKNLPPYKMFGRFLIVEIDLSYPRREINADIMAWVDQHRKKLIKEKIGPHQEHHELVKRPEPRDRDNSFKYQPMVVWRMVEEKRKTSKKSESKILSQLAKELCESEGWDKSYGEFEDDPETEDRVKTKHKALKAAYKRDKELYYGKAIFRGIPG